MHGAIEFSVNRQIGTFVRPFCRERLIDVDAEARRLARMHKTILKAVGMGENEIRIRCVAHVLLNAKVVNTQIEMKRRGHANRA